MIFNTGNESGLMFMTANKITLDRAYIGEIVSGKKYLIYDIFTRRWSFERIEDKDKKLLLESSLVYSLPEVVR